MTGTPLSSRLKAQSGDTFSNVADEGDAQTLTLVELPASVTFTLLPPEGRMLRSATLHRGEGVDPSAFEVAVGGKSATVTLPAVSAEMTGLYTARGELEPEGEATVSNAVLVEEAEAPDDGQSGGGATTDDVTEVKAGVFDARFSYVTLGVVALLGGLIWWTVSRAVAAIAFSDPTGVLEQDERPDGAFAERLAGVAILCGLLVGTSILLLGAWAALLETRGRLRSGAEVVAGRGLGTEAMKDFASVVNALRRVRGSVLICSLGAAIVAMSMLFALQLGNAASASPEPSPSPSSGSIQEPASPTGTSPAPDVGTGDDP